MRIPHTVRTTRGRLGTLAAAAVTALAVLAPAPAFAAASASPAAAAPTSPEAESTVTGTAPDAGGIAACGNAWDWEVAPDAPGGSGVEWLSNPDSCLIQERSWCAQDNGPSGYWATSGKVKGVDVWDSSSCKSGYYIIRAEYSMNDGSGWSTFATFWSD